MNAKWPTFARSAAAALRTAIRSIPFRAAALLVVSVLFKLSYLDGQLDVGGMNHWKWKVNLGALLMAVCWTALLGARARIVSIVLLDLLFSLIIVADLVYFRHFRDFVPVSALLRPDQTSPLPDSLSGLLGAHDLIYFADLPVFILLAVRAFYSRKKSRFGNPQPASRKIRLTIRALTGALVFAAGFQLVSVPVSIQKNGWASGLFEGNWWNIPIYNVAGLLGFHGYDAYRYARDHGLTGSLTEEQLRETKEWMDARRQLQAEAENDALFGAYKGSNVLIVQLESFQSFLIGLKINGTEVTPHLNRFIRQSAYFPNFYHQTANGRTSDADFVTNCSLHPLASGSVFVRFAGHLRGCLPQTLKAENYGTTVHHAYDSSFWNRNNAYYNMQYDRYYSSKDFILDEPLGWSLGDDSFFRQTLEQIRSREKYPFYAMAITLASHHPYAIGNHGLDAGRLEGKLLGNYVQAARYVDEAAGHLVERLKDAGLWENTIVVFYGDHDNSIVGWDEYETLFGRPVTELEKSTLRKQVPFFIHLPNDGLAGVYGKAVGQIDTAPTIRHLLGLSAAPYSQMGVSMLTNAPKPVVFRNGGFTDGTVYYIPGNEETPGNGTCYALADGSELDPALCKPGAEAAVRELRVSDRIVIHDLIPALQQASRP